MPQIALKDDSLSAVTAEDLEYEAVLRDEVSLPAELDYTEIRCGSVGANSYGKRSGHEAWSNIDLRGGYSPGGVGCRS